MIVEVTPNALTKEPIPVIVNSYELINKLILLEERMTISNY